MCAAQKRTVHPNVFFAIAIVLGVLCGYLQYPFFITAAEAVSEMFINLLKLISLPIIFLSIVSTVSGMEGVDQVKRLAQKVLKYTLLTTVIAATIALFLFVVINPVDQSILSKTVVDQTVVQQSTYLSFFMKIVPSNLVQPFNENQVISVLFLAILLSFAIISLPQAHRSILNQFFSSFYAAVIAITRWIVALMPIAVWAFITLFMRDLDQGLDVHSLALYLACVVGANLIQAFVVLPLFLKYKGISPLKMAKGMFPALSTAFFTKSSAAALPTAMRCAEENVGISRNVASFSFPLCTTINMNACAAFILITVLFVSMSNGMTYTFPEMCLWIILATIAAIGNAGVPMGCYMLASAFLAAMGIPLQIMTVFILPLYTLIDMLESAINVWSDSCVTAVVQQEVNAENGEEAQEVLA